jgi:seryl-tRNA synthetase
MMLNELKAVNVNRLDMDELILLSSTAKSMKREFEGNGVEIPEWLDDVARRLQREITSKNSDAVAAKVRHIQQKIDNLKTANEKKAELEAQLAALTATTAK